MTANTRFVWPVCRERRSCRCLAFGGRDGLRRPLIQRGVRG